MQFASGSAQQIWKTVEDRLGEAIAAARAGNLHNDRTHVDIPKKAIALHLLRSHRYMAIHDASVTEPPKKSAAEPCERGPTCCAKSSTSDTTTTPAPARVWVPG